MRVLDRKLVRDLMRQKGRMAAIALLIACGVSVAVMAFSAAPRDGAPDRAARRRAPRAEPHRARRGPATGSATDR
jgi:hypothetical protein